MAAGQFMTETHFKTNLLFSFSKLSSHKLIMGELATSSFYSLLPNHTLLFERFAQLICLKLFHSSVRPRNHFRKLCALSMHWSPFHTLSAGVIMSCHDWRKVLDAFCSCSADCIIVWKCKKRVFLTVCVWMQIKTLWQTSNVILEGNATHWFFGDRFFMLSDFETIAVSGLERARDRIIHCAKHTVAERRSPSLLLIAHNIVTSNVVLLKLSRTGLDIWTCRHSVVFIFSLRWQAQLIAISPPLLDSIGANRFLFGIDFVKI